MELRQGKCTSCGANINVNPTLQVEICQFCGNTYLVENAIQHVQYNNTNCNNVTHIHHHYGNAPQTPQLEEQTIQNEQRKSPKLSVGIVLLIIGIIITVVMTMTVGYGIFVGLPFFFIAFIIFVNCAIIKFRERKKCANPRNDDITKR